MQCDGTAIDGKQCRAEALPGDTLCPVHARRERYSTEWRRRHSEKMKEVARMRREEGRADWSKRLHRSVAKLRQSLRRHNEHVS